MPWIGRTWNKKQRDATETIGPGAACQTNAFAVFGPLAQSSCTLHDPHPACTPSNGSLVVRPLGFQPYRTGGKRDLVLRIVKSKAPCWGAVRTPGPLRARQSQLIEVTNMMQSEKPRQVP